MAREKLYPRLIIAVAAAATAAFVLSGCTTEDPAPVPTSDTSPAAPVFASDEEALAAATNAYIAYFKISDEILDSGGQDVEKLQGVTTEAQYQFELPDYVDAKRRKVHSSGSTSIDTVSLESYVSDSADGKEIVTLYACVDVSAIKVFDAKGKSVLEPDREVRLPFEPTFDLVDGRLLLSGGNPWTGKNFCI